jgi:hypothetical protein
MTPAQYNEYQRQADVIEEEKKRLAELPKQEILDGSKGSDAKSPQQEISDESWEGCDGCTEQDEIMYKNGYAKGYNAAIAEFPKEISDEEIEKKSKYWNETTNPEMWTFKLAWKAGAKWYREQLKQL